MVDHIRIRQKFTGEKKIMFILASFIFFCMISAKGQEDKEKLSARDKELLDHILSIPSSLNDLPKLVNKIIKPAQDQEEKIKLIYLWIAKNIKYDTRSFQVRDQNIYTAHEILNRKKAICSGYTGLFKAMSDEAGIPCYVVEGYSKGFGYTKKKEFKNIDHAWNVVYLGGEWKLLDVTWGAGYVVLENAQLKFKEQLRLSYFLTPPGEFVEDHLPANPMWQLLFHPVSIQSFSTFNTSREMQEIPTMYYNFIDTIKNYIQLPILEQELKSAEMNYNFNPTDKMNLAKAYYNYAVKLSSGSKEIETLKESLFYFKKVENILVKMKKDAHVQAILENCRQGIKYAEFYINQDK